MKDEVMRVFREFHEHGRFVKSLNTFFFFFLCLFRRKGGLRT